jgi:hypothetical protein
MNAPFMRCDDYRASSPGTLGLMSYTPFHGVLPGRAGLVSAWPAAIRRPSCRHGQYYLLSVPHPVALQTLIPRHHALAFVRAERHRLDIWTIAGWAALCRRPIVSHVGWGKATPMAVSELFTIEQLW